MKIRGLILGMALILGSLSMKAQDNITDSIDVLHYKLQLDIGNRLEKQIMGHAVVRMRILQDIDSITLELCPSEIDTVMLNNRAAPYRYDPAYRILKVPFSGNVGDTISLWVDYRKGQSVMSHGWGGFYFEDDIYYNLGIAIYEYPHCVGKAWFPCRDNFYDKATYDFIITAKPGWKAICSGNLISIDTFNNGSTLWHWELDKPTPTYLVGVAVAPFHIIEREYQSEYATYPAIIGYINHDSVNVWRAYENMSKVIPMFERCFGPYRWDRVGYVSTPQGSMEHVSNVAFVSDCMASQQEACFATMAHEFSHAWFGNLITCATSEDMWINEGGASFCEEVAIQALNADTRPYQHNVYARANLMKVLLQSHVQDGGFHAVYGPTHEHTYGSTVYKKGATVWHSLRGYMGEELFYSSLRQLFERHAFKNIDSWQLRDSLSQYSGMDLTDFFDFHVFNPGFVDYVIDSITTAHSSAAVYIRQKNYGTNVMANGNRVWITFFSHDLRKVKRLVTFDGEMARVVVQLPFKPDFAIVDYDGELSKASIGLQASMDSRGMKEMNDACFKVECVVDSTNAWLYVKHHWTKPDTATNPEIVKLATRYWEVTGQLPDNGLKGYFYFSRMGQDRMLDANFIKSSEQAKLVRLLYREDVTSPWRIIPTTLEGSTAYGYFVTDNLAKGEYTMAIVDTNLLAIDPPSITDQKGVRVFPNPSSGEITIETPVRGETLEIDVIDNTGKRLFSRLDVVSGEQLSLPLATGNYLFVIYRKETGVRNTVKVQIKNF